MFCHLNHMIVCREILLIKLLFILRYKVAHAVQHTTHHTIQHTTQYTTHHTTQHTIQHTTQHTTRHVCHTVLYIYLMLLDRIAEKNQMRRAIQKRNNNKTTNIPKMLPPSDPRERLWRIWRTSSSEFSDRLWRMWSSSSVLSTKISRLKRLLTLWSIYFSILITLYWFL